MSLGGYVGIKFSPHPSFMLIRFVVSERNLAVQTVIYMCVVLWPRGS